MDCPSSNLCHANHHGDTYRPSTQLQINAATMLWFENEEELIHFLSYSMIISGIVVVLALQFINAWYGRYTPTSSPLPMIPVRLAWILQELPALMVPIYLGFFNPDAHTKLRNLPNLILLMMFIAHYIQRALIYPWLIKGDKGSPLIPFLLAVVFCFWNGYIQGRYLTKFAVYPSHWLHSTTFFIGFVLFVCGLIINIHSDHILRNLRKPRETGYKIPYGGAFNYVSGANFLGEIIEWTGFAIACWNLPALAFAIFTASNIGPRATAHHRWYLEKFKSEYPSNRKALIPFLL